MLTSIARVCEMLAILDIRLTTDAWANQEGEPQHLHTRDRCGDGRWRNRFVHDTEEPFTDECIAGAALNLEVFVILARHTPTPSAQAPRVRKHRCQVLPLPRLERI